MDAGGQALIASSAAGGAAAWLSSPLSWIEYLVRSGLGGRCVAFLGLFATSAFLHAAEVAITTLYPWKVKEFAEEEGPRSPFATLDRDITRALTAILVATTCANVCSTAIFADVVTTCLAAAAGSSGEAAFGASRGLAYATGGLTAATLFFGELLPKAVGVNNAEFVARGMAPVVNAISFVLGPVGDMFSTAAKTLLRRVFRVEFRGVENAVSEEELRLIVGGATASGGIESLEGTMIEGVLDLQDTRVSEIMRPRVEVDALERNETMLTLLELVNATGHSRIPVYADEIDNVVGVVNAKKLLEYVKSRDDATIVSASASSSSSKTTTTSSSKTTSSKTPPTLPATPRTASEREVLEKVFVKDCCEPTYFVPETMLAWKVLEEMRRRRVHMAIVVDEFGGTAGVVTLEDILELVVGEIYDEDDREAFGEADAIVEEPPEEPGRRPTYVVKGTAPVDDLVDALGLAAEGVDPDDLPDVTTAAGFVCYHAGEIPQTGDHVFVANFDFEILDADERRVFKIRATSLDDPLLSLSEAAGSSSASSSSSSSRGGAAGGGSQGPHSSSTRTGGGAAAGTNAAAAAAAAAVPGPPGASAGAGATTATTTTERDHSNLLVAAAAARRRAAAGGSPPTTTTSSGGGAPP